MKQGVLITRPLPLATRTAAAVAAQGFRAYTAPLLKIEALPFTVPAGRFDGAVFTSAAAFRLKSISPFIPSPPRGGEGNEDLAAQSAALVEVGKGEWCQLSAMVTPEYSPPPLPSPTASKPSLALRAAPGLRRGSLSHRERETGQSGYKGFDKNFPLYLVGSQTEIAAKEAGFDNIRHCAPDVAALAQWLNRQDTNPPQTLIYYCGVHQSHDLAALLAPPIELQSIPVYDSHVQPLSAAHRRHLRQGDIQWIVLYSRRTAQALAAEIAEMVDKAWCKGTTLLCLSSAVMEPLNERDWRGVRIAATPDEAALLACLQEGWAKPDGDGKQSEPR